MAKNIMLLIGYLSNGGAEHSIIKLANELQKKHNVILVVVSKRNQDYETTVPIIEVPDLKNKKKKIFGIRKIRQLKKEYKIDVTISYTTVFNFFNAITKYKDKVIISVRNHLSTKKEGFIPTILHKISLKKADKIVCCSNSVANDQINNYHAAAEKVAVITNFCNLEEIATEVKKRFSKEDKPIVNDHLVVALARLVPHKGHKHIIKAMSLVVKNVKDAHLVIFSRGPQKEYLEELVKKYHLENNVFFLGFHPNPYQFLKKAKCFILASDYEGFPNVIIEAMSCGTPVIATDAPGGSKEILSKTYDFNNITTKLTKSDYGLLIPSFINEHEIETITKNEKILAKAIIELLENKQTYEEYHKKSLTRINDFTNILVMQDWLKIIEE